MNIQCTSTLKHRGFYFKNVTSTPRKYSFMHLEDKLLVLDTRTVHATSRTYVYILVENKQHFCCCGWNSRLMKVSTVVSWRNFARELHTLRTWSAFYPMITTLCLWDLVTSVEWRQRRTATLHAPNTPDASGRRCFVLDQSLEIISQTWNQEIVWKTWNVTTRITFLSLQQLTLEGYFQRMHH